MKNLKINMCTDSNYFGVIACKKISVFKGEKKQKRISSTTYKNTFLGFSNIYRKEVFINLPKCYSIANTLPLLLIDVISDTIQHEILHCVLEELDDKNSVQGSERIIGNHFDDVQLYFNYIRISNDINKELIWGKENE